MEVRKIPALQTKETKKQQQHCSCEPDKEQLSKMSPEGRAIYASMQWSVSGFVPSYETTDAVLMKASRKVFTPSREQK